MFRSAFCLFFFLANTIFVSLILYPFLILKVLVRMAPVQTFCTRVMMILGESWIEANNIMWSLTQKTNWQVTGLENLRPDRSYLVCSNHQSWVDIPVLQKVFNRRIPFLRFFLKQELIYFPFLGAAWWALDFPFMKRYSKEFLLAHPEKVGVDLATTRKTVEKFRGKTISIINFLEGTRFTQAKRDSQKSPFKNLLLPKAGGLAFVIDSMGDQFESLLDVTIIYPQGAKSMWDNFKGKKQDIIVHINKLDIPKEFLNRNYSTDEIYRTQFQAWIRDLWQKKDTLISQKVPAYFSRSAAT